MNTELLCTWHLPCTLITGLISSWWKHYWESLSTFSEGLEDFVMKIIKNSFWRFLVLSLINVLYFAGQSGQEYQIYQLTQKITESRLCPEYLLPVADQSYTDPWRWATAPTSGSWRTSSRHSWSLFSSTFQRYAPDSSPASLIPPVEVPGGQIRVLWLSGRQQQDSVHPHLQRDQSQVSREEQSVDMIVWLCQSGPWLHVLLHPLDQAPLHWHHPLLLPVLHEHEDIQQDETDLPLHGQVQVLHHQEGQQPRRRAHSNRWGPIGQMCLHTINPQRWEIPHRFVHLA